MDVKHGVATVTGISVTLNGGKKEMNSATIPVEWWLSEEVIKKDPKYILIFEQNEEEKNDINGEMVRGRRYGCKVSDAVTFMPVFSPGYHRVMVIAVSDARGLAGKRMNEFLEKKRGIFDLSLNWRRAENNEYAESDDAFVAATVAEFEVPEELFARKPETRASQLMWKWVNRWYGNAPQDECDYRRRKMLAFTIQPPLVAIGWLMKYGIGGTAYALYILLASFATFFVGFRPRPIFKEMWRAFTFTRYREWDVSRYGFTLAIDGWRGESTYRVWSVAETTRRAGKPAQEATYMPVAPFVVALIGGAGVGTYYLINGLFSGWLAWLLPHAIGIACVVAVVLFAKVVSPYFSKTVSKGIKKLKENAEKEAFVQKTTRKDMEQRWMLENLSLSKQTNAVYLDRLPIPLDLRERVVQRFRVGYWTLKARVCKPFMR